MLERLLHNFELLMHRVRLSVVKVPEEFKFILFDTFMALNLSRLLSFTEGKHGSPTRNMENWYKT